MLNIFKKPIEKPSLEAWSKMTDDVAKIALLAFPVILYGERTTLFKTFNLLLLAIGIYSFLLLGRVCRKLTIQQNKEENK